MKPMWLLVLVVLLGTPPAHAGAELILQDGKILSGESVQRKKEGVYLLTTEDGDVLTVPVELVKKLRLTGGEPEEDVPTGLKVAEPGNLVGPPESFVPPTTREQLAAFGRPPALFRRPAIDSNWRPKNSLGPDVANFNPARWYRAPIDPFWKPVSAFQASRDVTSFHPVRWYQPALDSVWRPTSGWWKPERPVPESAEATSQP